MYAYTILSTIELSLCDVVSFLFFINMFMVVAIQHILYVITYYLFLMTVTTIMLTFHGYILHVTFTCYLSVAHTKS